MKHLVKKTPITFSRCVVDVRWLAGVTYAQIIDSNDPETVRHVGPQREDCMHLVTFYSIHLLPAPLLQTLILKFNHILCRQKKNKINFKSRVKKIVRYMCWFVLNLEQGCCGHLLESS